MKEFMKTRLESKESFSKIQDEIDKLREIQEEIRKREAAIKAIKRSF